MSNTPNTESDRERQRARRILSLLGSAVIGIVLGAISLVAIFAIVGRDPSPPVTRETFDAAFQRWGKYGPASYDMQVEVSGRQPATYRVEVRDGEAVSLSRNGYPLKSRRSFETWSVPGMFATIERDLRTIQSEEEGQGDEHTPQLSLRGTFHPKYGYPDRYRRIEWGTGDEVIWQVTEFIPLDE